MGTIFLVRPGTYVQYHLAGLQVRFDLIDLTLGQKRIGNNDRGHLWSLFTSVKKMLKKLKKIQLDFGSCIFSSPLNHYKLTRRPKWTYLYER